MPPARQLPGDDEEASSCAVVHTVASTNLRSTASRFTTRGDGYHAAWPQAAEPDTSPARQATVASIAGQRDPLGGRRLSYVENDAGVNYTHMAVRNYPP